MPYGRAGVGDDFLIILGGLLVECLPVAAASIDGVVRILVRLALGLEREDLAVSALVEVRAEIRTTGLVSAGIKAETSDEALREGLGELVLGDIANRPHKRNDPLKISDHALVDRIARGESAGGDTCLDRIRHVTMVLEKLAVSHGPGADRLPVELTEVRRRG